MTARSRRPIACLALDLLISSILLCMTSPSQVPDNVKSLIYSIQYKYCGGQFCNKDDNYKSPICHDTLIAPIFDPVTNLTPSIMGSVHRQEHPPCYQCSCDDNCVIFGDCCADKHIGGQYFFECQTAFEQIFDRIQDIYISVVSKCLPGALNYNLDLAEKCDHGELGYIQDGRLVTAQHSYNTSITFKNKYCAICYGVTGYTAWDVYISCQNNSNFNFSNYTNLNSLIRAVMESSSCNVTTKHKDDSHSLLCSMYIGMISTCNVTGRWQEYNESMEIACHSYLNPVLSYRNLFCALCNGESEEQLLCPDGDVELPSHTDLFMPFSAILNFDSSDVEVVRGRSQAYPITRIGKQEQHQCRPEDLYDSVSRKCRELYCPLSFEPDNVTCVQLVSSENLVMTIWKLTVYYTDSILVPYGILGPSVGETVIHELKGFLKESGFLLFKGLSEDYASIHSTSDFIIKESQLELELLLQQNHTLMLARQRLETFENYIMNITWEGQVLDLLVEPCVKPKNKTKMFLISTPAFGHMPFKRGIIDINKHNIKVSLDFNISCTMFRFEPSEVLIDNNSIIIHEDVILDEHEYVMHDRDYFICPDSLFRMKEKNVSQELLETTVSDINFKIEQLVTIICFSCSLIFLAITILVYSFIHQPHTIPGLNLIFLSSSLFVAQTLYFFGAGAVATPTTCIVIGVFIHYFWLVSFAWMNVCCLHMFRVFTSPFNSLVFVDDKKCLLLKYSAFAYGVPLVIVGSTMSTSYIASDYTSLSYGGPTLCLVSSGLVSLLSFGVPAGVTVITNLLLLVYAIITLRRTKNLQTSKCKTGTSDITKFFKLSTITGVSWLFGFLGYFLQRVELLYVFTVFTAGQGVFIFFSFVASRRILKMFRERFVCPRPKSSRGHRNNDTSRTPRTVSESLPARNSTNPM